jgi:hypothetical protein
MAEFDFRTGLFSIRSFAEVSVLWPIARRDRSGKKLRERWAHTSTGPKKRVGGEEHSAPTDRIKDSSVSCRAAESGASSSTIDHTWIVPPLITSPSGTATL